jgi:Raf kinase inhibitor-like YbhB/YbcL family protein
MRRFLALAAFAALAAIPLASAAQQPARGKPAFSLHSPSFPKDGPIPRRYSKEGDDVSPSLLWSDAPEGTKEFALIVDDPDAARAEPWVHWVAYGISGDAQLLAEGTKTGFVAGKNDFGETRYGGPMPPPGHGVHHYRFKIYALDVPLNASPGLTKAELLHAMGGHVIATAEFVGTYERK